MYTFTLRLECVDHGDYKGWSMETECLQQIIPRYLHEKIDLGGNRLPLKSVEHNIHHGQYTVVCFANFSEISSAYCEAPKRWKFRNRSKFAETEGAIITRLRELGIQDPQFEFTE